MKVMPVEGDYRFHEPPPIRTEEVEKLDIPVDAPTEDMLRALDKQREMEAIEAMANSLLSAEIVQAMMAQMEMGKYIIEPKQSPPPPKKKPPEYQAKFISALEAMEKESWGFDLKAMGYKIEPEAYKGDQRVKMDVRLEERQIPEAMSNESKVFKQAIKRGLERDLLRALDATAGMGFVKEDWEVLRQSLIEIIGEQSRLYFRDNSDERGKPEATITFEIPKMTMSFRMPLDDRFDT